VEGAPLSSKEPRAWLRELNQRCKWNRRQEVSIMRTGLSNIFLLVDFVPFDFFSYLCIREIDSGVADFNKYFVLFLL